MRTLPGLRNVAMSPWSYAASDPNEIAELDARAANLGVIVSTVKRSRDGRWMARARGSFVASVVGATLAGAIRGALDEYEEHVRDRYTAEELVQIYNQSGGI